MTRRALIDAACRISVDGSALPLLVHSGSSAVKVETGMTDVVVNVIENPYHKAEIKPHHLDVGEARLACFDAFNIVSASDVPPS